MNIKQLNEHLEKFIEREISVNLIPDSDDPEVINKWIKKSFGTKNKIKKNNSSPVLNKIKFFINKNDDLSSTVIGYEFLDEDIITSDTDNLYFNGAESIPNDICRNLTNICKQLVINALQNKTINVDHIKNQLISSLKEIIITINTDKNIEVSDDATQSGAQSLYAIPLLIKEFCKSLNTSASQEIYTFLDNNDLCIKAIEKADELMKTLN